MGTACSNCNCNRDEQSSELRIDEKQQYSATRGKQLAYGGNEYPYTVGENEGLN